MKMFIGTAKISIYLGETHSLKEKRSILQSLLKRLQNKFNAAVAEVADQDLWQKATIGIAVIGGSASHADSQLQAIINMVESDPLVRVGEVETELL